MASGSSRRARGQDRRASGSRLLSRANMYSFLGYQPRIVQKIGLGADEKGALAAVTHDVVNLTSVTDDFIEFATEASKSLYATRSMRLSQRAERAHVAMPTAMQPRTFAARLWCAPAETMDPTREMPLIALVPLMSGVWRSAGTREMTW